MSILDIVTRAPLWVWPLLLGLIAFGLRLTRDRETSAVALAIMPIVLAGFAVQSLATVITPASLLGLAIGAAAGIAISIGLEQRNPAARVAPGRLRIKGEWTPLIIILAIFALRFGNGVMLATDPVLAAGDAVRGIIGVAAGLSGGILLTRAALRLRVAYA
jgi:hypothetical protein